MDLIQFFRENPGYLKTGSQKIAQKFNVSVKDVINARRVIRESFKSAECPTVDNSNENTSTINEFNRHLDKLGLTEEDVKSVKFWQTVGGDNRYSVVTRNEENTLPDLESILEAIRKEVTPLPKVDIPLFNKGYTLVVYMSDKHIGAAVGEDAPYEVKYNSEILRDRMLSVAGEIQALEYNYPLEHLVIVDLGDALDGYNAQTTRGGHVLPQNMTNKEAFDAFISLHKEFYTGIVSLNLANKYTFAHITESNHGGEFEYFATRALEEYINTLYKDTPNISFLTLTQFINPISIAGNTFLLCHGKDSVDMRNGLPLTLDAKTHEYITNYVIDKGLNFGNIHFIKGDLHQASTQQSKRFRYRNIPSMFGSSKWIMTNHGLTRPGCSFDFIEGYGKGSSIKQWEAWFNDSQEEV